MAIILVAMEIELANAIVTWMHDYWIEFDCSCRCC